MSQGNTDREKLERYRRNLKRHTTEELWKKYKRDLKKSGIKHNVWYAEKQAEKMMKSIRFYERYVKVLEKELKAQIKQEQQKVKEALKQVKAEKAKNARLEKRIAELEKAAGASGKTKRDKKIQDVAAKTKARVERHFEGMEAKQRGETLGRGVGKNASGTSDTYSTLLDAMEADKHVPMTEVRKQSLMNSSKFKSEFIRKFAGLNDEERAKKWNEYFGEGAGSTKPFEGDLNVSWRFTGLKNKRMNNDKSEGKKSKSRTRKKA